MSGDAPHILCAGLVALDLEMRVANHPLQGIKHRATGSRMTHGGGALNAAVAIVRLGAQVTLAGAIGADDLGAILCGRIDALGVRRDLLQIVPGQATPHSAVLITPDGERTIINRRDDGLDLLPSIPEPFAFGAALADTRFPRLSEAVLAAARAAGRPAVLDAEAPVRIAEAVLREASHVAFSVQGLVDYAGRADAVALAEVARDLGTWVCVTRGPDPVLCHDGQGAYEVPVPKVEAVNTNGAGDLWHGAFALALARGENEAAAVKGANEAAARFVSSEVSPRQLIVEGR
ncbi:carbohydrate kinase family protein [Roseovarius sp.]|uniref:carbohydrate kinase family protein n=1 Tax=Roseovarius sp. TaxID=1486281 RepID=UPI003569237C